MMRVEYRARTGDGFGNFGIDQPDRVERVLRPQSYLDDRQSAARERPGQWHGIGQPTDLEDGNNRLPADRRNELLCLVAHSVCHWLR